jgi:hypothetical protein
MRCLLALSLSLLVACNPKQASSTSENPNPSPNPSVASPDVSAPQPGDEARCRLLDSTNLDERVDAAEQLSDSHAPVHVGGTEQVMEAAGEWCARTFGIRPGWLPGSCSQHLECGWGHRCDGDLDVLERGAGTCVEAECHEAGPGLPARTCATTQLCAYEDGFSIENGLGYCEAP